MIDKESDFKDLFDKYEEASDSGLRKIGLRAFSSFAPVTFNTHNFIAWNKDFNKQVLYFDLFHEGLSATYLSYLDKLTEFEDQRLVQIIDFYRVWAEYIGLSKSRPIPKNAFLYSLLVARFLRVIERSVKKTEIQILEIGPGSGTLPIWSNLALEKTFTWTCVENCQALFLYQAQMFELYSKKVSGQYHNPFFIGDDIGRGDGEKNDKENVLKHEPWFSLVTKGLEKSELDVDIILANNCLTEMSPRALAFYLNMYEKGADSPIWICQGFGGRRILTNSLIWHAQEVIISFMRSGYYFSFYGPGSLCGNLPFAIFSKGMREDLSFLSPKLGQPITVSNQETYVKCIQSFSFDSRFSSSFLDTQHTEVMGSGDSLDQGLFMENIDEKFLKMSAPLASSKF